MVRTLALGAVMVAGTATAGMAQGVNNTGYDRNGPYYGDNGYRGGYYGNPGYNGYYGNQGYGGYYGYNRGYTPGPVEGAANVVGGALNAAGNIAGSAVNAAGNVAGAVLPPYGPRYDYYGNNYGYGSSYQPGWAPGYSTSEQRGWGSGGGAAYDRGYSGYNSGYWGR
jgi:hypothetical protein